MIANKASWANPAKRKKIETIALLLKGALEAGSKVGLKMNLPKAALEAVVKALPALRNPTISQLSSPEWIAPIGHGTKILPFISGVSNCCVRNRTFSGDCSRCWTK